MKSVVLLVSCSLALWAALLYPGWVWWGEAAFFHSAAAWTLCVVPGAAAMAWAMSKHIAPESRALTALAGTGIRLMVTLGGGLMLTELLPETFTKIFWLWVGVFYLLMLTLEVILLVRFHQRSTAA